MQNESSHDHHLSPPTLAARIKQVLETSAGPIELSKIKTAVLKFYPKGTKKDPQPPQPTEAEIQAVLDGSGFHKYPPTRASGQPKYSHEPPPDLLEVMQKTVFQKLQEMGDGPFSATSLGKPPQSKGPEAQAAFEKVIGDLKARHQLFDYPGGKFGKLAPPPSPIELIRQTVNHRLTVLGEGPFNVEELGQPLETKGEQAKAFKAVLKELLDSQTIFKHPGGKYGKKEPPPPPSPLDLMRGTVESKLEGLGDGPFTAKQLGQPKQTDVEKTEAFNKVVEELKAAHRLFDYPGGKYGKKQPVPPKWYQLPPQKKEFDKLENAANKLLETGKVSPQQILDALRERFGLIGPKPNEPAPNNSDLVAAVQEIFHRLKREKHFLSGAVPIHEIRREIRSSLGDRTASHEILDPVLTKLQRDGQFRLIEITIASRVSQEALNDSLPGPGGIIYFYAEIA